MNQPTDITAAMAPDAIQPSPADTSTEREPDVNALDIAAIELGILKKFVAFLETQQRARQRSRKRTGNVRPRMPSRSHLTPAASETLEYKSPFNHPPHILALAAEEKAKRRASMKAERERLENERAHEEEWTRITRKYQEQERDGKWSEDDPDIKLMEEFRLLTRFDYQPKFPRESETTN